MRLADVPALVVVVADILVVVVAVVVRSLLMMTLLFLLLLSFLAPILRRTREDRYAVCVDFHSVS